jgi:microcin C transport system substrate-binding protein
MGSWDSFNPIPLRGRVVVGTYFWVKQWRYLWDTLLRDALDEPATWYGLIARGVAVGPDDAWIAFRLRDEARWHDGTPISVDDLVYTFEVATTIANPTISEPLAPFSHAEIIAPREVRFHVKESYRGNPVLPIRLGNMAIMPKHYWTQRDISKTTVEPPLGSGPYKVGRFSVGRWVEWQRVQDYWAADLLVNRGHWNFDVLRREYFRDNQVQSEAVKAHVLDAHIEDIPRTWEMGYDIPAVRAGLLKKRQFKLAKPAGLWWPMFFNMDVAKFQDIRVREAFWLLGDYDWGARRSYNFYGRGTSFFTGSELAARGLPGELELDLLEPLREHVPPRVFTHPFEPQPNTGNGNNRENLLHAARLLKEAGWIVRDNQLVNAETGEPFEVRFLAVSDALGRGFVSFTKRLQRLGIATSIQAPEVSNWLYRMRSGDFDVGAIWFLPEIPPTQLVGSQFRSIGADQDYSYNWANIRDPAVDALIDALHDAPTWDAFIAAARALDRVLLWNFYFLPNSSKTVESMVHWDKFDQPEYSGPLYRHAEIMTWWFNPQKAARVAEFVGSD